MSSDSFRSFMKSMAPVEKLIKVFFMCNPLMNSCRDATHNDILICAPYLIYTEKRRFTVSVKWSNLTKE